MIILRLFQSSFSYVRAVSSDCLRLVGVWFRVSEAESVSRVPELLAPKNERRYQQRLAN